MATVHAVTVRRAAEIVGGVKVLAAQLDVGDENLKNWMEGQVSVPQEIFLRCVDIVNAHQLSEISGRSTNQVPKGSA
jgi:DNA-binding transcriptional regulator YdaS (Cro superfamily)